MKLPNFFIVGAAKSGTTSLYSYLSQHPDIYLSRIKEPKFFSVSANKFPHNGPGDSDVDSSIIKNWDDYIELFKDAEHEKIIGEASADYLYFNQSVIQLICEYNPGAKILIILRNPVDRAFSAYRHMLKDKRETLSFEKALKAEENRIRCNFEFIWFYKDVGFYHHRVLEYLKTFNKSSVKICLYDDLTENSSEVTKDILKFLEVDENFTPDTNVIHNESRITINKTVNNFLAVYDHPAKKILRPVLLKTIGLEKTEFLVNYFKNKNLLKMKPQTRRYLIDLYRDDILQLQDLLNRDLSAWLKF